MIAEPRPVPLEEEFRMLVADYTFIDLFWSLLVFFLWVLAIWLLVMIWADIFRREDLSGLGKTGWLLFTIVLPYLGAFVYLITNNDGMTERNTARGRRQAQRYDPVIQQAERLTSAPSGLSPAEEIAQGKSLLDRGVITQAEFDVLKTNALART
jgi:hypothetical protein